MSDLLIRSLPLLAFGEIGAPTIIAIVVIVVLLFASACMSASEVAMFSLSPTQLRDLKERGGASGQRVLDLLAKPRRLLATILVLNNFALVGITRRHDGLRKKGKLP